MSTENGPEPTETTAQPTPPEPKPEPAHAEASAPEGEHEGEHDGEAGHEGEASEAGGEAAPEGAPGEPGKKKRRRRRKKKGDAPVQLGPDGQPLQAPPPPEPKPRRDLSALPFARFFPEGGGRRHILSPGEAVAGRVVEVSHGVAVIDLFGRGIAYATETEPREIPAPAPEEHEPEHSAAADPGAVAGALAQMDGHVGMPASESLPPPPPMDGSAVPEATAETESVPAPADPYAIAQAAQGLLRVGTPMIDSDGDGIPDELDETPHGESSPGTETAAGTEEAPAEEAAPEAPPIEPGTVFRGRIAAVAENGSVALYNRPFVRKESQARLADAMKARRRVFGIVFGYNRGGFDVLVEGLRAFCPISGLSLEHIDAPEPLLGRRLEFSVQQAKAGHQGVVVSRRGILEREARKRARELRRSLSVGQVLKGRVTSVRDFGLIVDLGGIEGLVHMSEVSWDRSVRPVDAAKPGDEVDVKIVRLGAHEPRPGQRAEGKEGRDRKRDGRIGLSIKACLPDPFETELKEMPEGTIKKGKVTRVAEFGAFIELAPGVEGLLHVSELGKDLRHAGEKIKEGEEVYVCIDRVDIKARRVGLSKLSEQDAKLFEEGTLTQSAGGKAVRPGATLKVRVEKVESAGLVVQIDGVVGKRGRGFVPNSEMGTEKGTDHRKKFPPGTEMDVKIVGIDRDGGWRMSKKALAHDEERKAIQDYRREASAKGFGTFGDLLKRKLKI
jgi:small subunit ribosomal protein S1